MGRHKVRLTMAVLFMALMFSVLPWQSAINPLQPAVARANGYIDFEDGVDRQPIRSTIPGLQFTTTDGQDWIYGDWRTGGYNGKYPNGSYSSNGNFFAWLGENQGNGRIDFTGGGATYLSVGVSTYSYVTLAGYDASGNQIAQISFNQSNMNTGRTDELRIQAPQGKQFKYVIVSGEANYWLIDDLFTDAAGVPNTRTPVILLPGIMGTRLLNNAGEVWPNELILIDRFYDEQLRVLELGKDGASPAQPSDIRYSSVRTGDIIRDLPIGGDVYQSLIDYFVDQRKYQQCKTYVEVCAEGTLFVFPYDWRKDLTSAANELDNYIRRVKQSTGAPKVNIVAHSMGGLVARSYISDSQRAANVETMVTLGTPYLGAPKAYRATHYTECMLDKFLPAGCWLNRQTLKELVQNYPGVYQLLPTETYFNVYPNGHLKIDYDSNGDGKTDGWQSYDQVKEILTQQHNPLLVNKAEAFHASIDSYRGGTNGVRVYAFVGDRQSTPGPVREYLKPKWFNRGQKLEYDFQNTTGDGTVPLHSADLGRNLGSRDYSGSVSYFYAGLEHGALARWNDGRSVLRLVGDILETRGSAAEAYITSLQAPNEASQTQTVPDPNALGQPPRATAATAADDVLIRTEPELFYGRQIVVQGEVQIEVEDAQGNMVKVTSNEGILTNIPGSSFSQIGTSTSIFLPEGGDYTVRLLGDAEDVVDLKLRTIAEEVTTETVVFKDVEVSSATAAQLDYNTTTTQEYQLNVDTNGDGTTDVVEKPLAIVGEQASADVTAPTSSINLQGIRSPNGWYVGEVTVSITATDNEGGSGLATIQYSVDGGATVNTYTNSFTVNADAVSSILVKAVDNNGNEQANFTEAPVGPQKLFKPIITR